MKTNTLVKKAIEAYNKVTSAGVDRFNAWYDAWYDMKSKGATPSQFRAAMLAAFDENPLVEHSIGSPAYESAFAKKRNSLSSALTQFMPRIDPSVDWKERKAGGGKKSDFEKAGILAPQIKSIQLALVKSSLTPAQISVVLKKLGIKP